MCLRLLLLHSRHIIINKTNPPMAKTPNMLITGSNAIWPVCDDVDVGTSELLGVGDIPE